MAKNLSEILELSKWLHENGVEADMIYDSDNDILEFDLPSEIIEVDPNIYQPYLTLERCLEELPEVIYYEGQAWYLEFCHDHICYFYEVPHEGRGYYNPPVKEEAIEDYNYHLDALRLLKRVKEAGGGND